MSKVSKKSKDLENFSHKESYKNKERPKKPTTTTTPLENVSQPEPFHDTAARLRKICEGHLECINKRDFDPASPAWASTALPDAHFYHTNEPDYARAADGTSHFDLAGMCAMLANTAEQNPSWQARVCDFAVTVYDHRPVGGVQAQPRFLLRKTESSDGRLEMKGLPTAYAEAWLRGEHNGLPEGCTRSFMWIGNFVLLGDEWWVENARHVSGMELMGPI